MEFPFHRHHRRDEDEEESRFPQPGRQHRPDFDGPPPPRPYGNDFDGPPPPRPYGSDFDGPPPPRPYGSDFDGPPPPRRYGNDYDAPPPQFGENAYGAPGYPPVQHVSHGYEPPPPAYGGGGGGGGYEEPHREHHHRPFSSHNVEHVAHESYGGGGGSANQQRTVRVFTKAKEDFALSIRDGKVVLAPANPRDEHQHWIKDMRYSTKVKDQESLPSFALVNKVTGEAIKHSVSASHPVRLVPYNPEYLDESVLWTESHDTGGDYRCIRMVNNISLNFDAFHGDNDHGGVRDGTPVVLWEWTKGDNQRWKIIPY